MRPQSEASKLTEADPVLADLLEDIAHRFEAGDPVELEAYCASYPQYAERLRRLFPAVQALADLGQSAARGETSVPPIADGFGMEAGVLGDYRIVREIGRGGMGIVYEAQQISLNRRVALKVLPFASVLDEKRLRRFHQEAQAAAQLHHTNIVPVFGSGCERGLHHYAMQYIDGQNLATVIRDLRACTLPGPSPPDLPSALQRVADQSAAPEESPTPPLPAAASVTQPVAALTTERTHQGVEFFRKVADLGRQAAEALEHAHQEGVVHRDIKPANLIVDQRGNLWITDFGLARCQTDLGMTGTGDLVGTLRYMSPEQALGKRDILDARTDVYSLGATLYELLCLSPPVDGRDRQDLLRQIAFEEPRPLRSRDRTIPAELEVIVGKALAKEPGDRYRTARAMADDLRCFLEHKPIRARRPTLLQRAAKWGRRRPAGAALLAAAVLISALGFGVVSKWQEAMLAGQAALQAQQAVEKALEKVQGQQQLVENARNEAAEAKKQMNKQWAAAQERRVATGMSLQERGDPLGALPWFAKALAEAKGDLERAAMLRRRLQEALAHCPRLVHLWAHQPGRVRYAEFSPDGRRVVTASEDQTARVWDLETGESLVPPLKHEDWVHRAVFNPDGRRVVTASQDGTRVWDTETGRPLATLQHDGPVTVAAFSPDGHSVVTASLDKTARLWDAADGQPLAMPLKHSARVIHAAFGPNGRCIVTCSDDCTARLWDAKNGQPLIPPIKHDNFSIINHVVISPDGRRLATACNDEAQFWDAETGRPVSPPLKQGRPVYHVGFSPDGRLVVIVGHIEAQIWDVESGRPVGQPLKHRATVFHAAFSPNGRRVVTASEDQTAQIWNAQNGQPLSPPLKHRTEVVHAAFSPDGRGIVTTSHGVAQVWDITSRLPPIPPSKGDGLVVDAAFNPDGRRVIAASDGRTADVWEKACEAWPPADLLLLTGLLSGHCIDDEEMPTSMGQIDMAGAWRTLRAKYPDFFSPTPAEVRDWHDCEARACEQADLWAGAVQHLTILIALEPNHPELRSRLGQATAKNQHFLRQHEYMKDLQQAYLFWHTGQVQLMVDRLSRYRPGPGQEDRRCFAWHYLWRLCHAEKLCFHGHTGEVYHVAFSHDGRLAASCGQDGTVRLWDPGTAMEVRVLRGHKGDVNVVTFARDGSFLVTVGDDGTIRLWEVRTGRELGLMQDSTEGVAAALSADGRLLATRGRDNLVKFWDVPSRKQLAHPPGFTGEIEFVSFSPDLRTLVNVNQGDSTRTLWDVESKKERATLRSTPSRIRAVCFSHNGRLLATAGVDKFVSLWDAHSGQRLANLETPAEDCYALAFSPDDTLLASGSEDAQVRLWDVNNRRLLQTIKGHCDRIWCVTFSADGKRVASASRDGTVKLWNTAGVLDRVLVSQELHALWPIAFFRAVESQRVPVSRKP